MKSRTMLNEQPSLPSVAVVDALNEYLTNLGIPGVRWSDLVYFAWAEKFGSSAGPFPGIGCQACTEFRMEAWAHEQWAVIFCDSRVVKVGELILQASYR